MVKEKKKQKKATFKDVFISREKVKILTHDGQLLTDSFFITDITIDYSDQTVSISGVSSMSVKQIKNELFHR